MVGITIYHKCCINKEDDFLVKVRWLHASDFHLNKTGVDTQRMRKKLLDYLKKQKHCDYVFFTGDLRYEIVLDKQDKMKQMMRGKKDGNG
jgi:predicted MPP superfamily phosphohydrolase